MSGSRTGVATMRAMNVTSKLLRSSAAALAALVLIAAPVSAAEEAPAETGTEAPTAGDEGAGEHGSEPDKITLASGPRDYVRLLLLGVLLVGGGLAVGNARRQLKGDRPQASGEFRWR